MNPTRREFFKVSAAPATVALVGSVIVPWRVERKSCDDIVVANNNVSRTMFRFIAAYYHRISANYRGVGRSGRSSCAKSLSKGVAKGIADQLRPTNPLAWPA